MLITSYNQPAMGDALVAMTAPSKRTDQSVTKGNITVIAATDGSLVGVNFLQASELIDLGETAGQIFLTDQQVAKLNASLKDAGFEVTLTADEDPKFVVGYVETAEPHPDSDHLQITSTQVSDTENVQIVSGSPNMQAGIKVVVAKVGAMMPSGLIIWPGALRGVDSNGMIVSGRELGLPNAPQVPGAMILPDDFAPVGTPFDVQSQNAQQIFN
jgi:tRNA-binding protein